MATPNCPKLSVLLVTYNQENFVRQALHSVLMQQTDFDFEIIVADDCSQDSSGEIIQEYAARGRPLHVLPSDRNVGITRNYQRGFAACRGEYIAVLEGDDYWISPDKLNTLSRFLDQNQHYTGCFHRVMRHDEITDRVAIYPKPENQDTSRDVTARELARYNVIPGFSSCMYRRDVVSKLDPALFQMRVYDWMFNIAVTEAGPMGYVPEVLSVYRVHPSATWSVKPPDEMKTEFFHLVDTYNAYLNFKFDSEFQEYKRCYDPVLENAESPAPKLSVLLVTYNQQNYVRQAIESVLMQKADFDYELVVADDFSTDLTLAIVREYEAVYKNVRVLPTEEHLGITRNYQRGFAACRGEYIAVLEGDDYLIVSGKLGSVAKYLDENPTCVFCFHRVIRHDETCDDTAIYPPLATGSQEKYFTARELASGNFVPGFSACTYRRDIIVKLDPALWNLKVREWPFNIVVAQNGSIGYLPAIMSVYRAHTGGIWSLKSAKEHLDELVELLDQYNKLLNSKYESEFQAIIEKLTRHVRGGTPPPVDWHPSPLKPAPRQRVKNWLRPFVPPILLTIARKLVARG